MTEDLATMHRSLALPSSPDRIDINLRTPPSRIHHDILQQEAKTPTDPVDYLDSKKKFESIVEHVNRTLQQLSEVYTEIGYSNREINQRQAEVFLTIDETIKSINSNALREKDMLQNECEWLRQQIRFMLATLDDGMGERTLRLSSRGVVFEDDMMYSTGYREDMKEKVSGFNPLRQEPTFDEVDDMMNDDYSMQQQYDYMTMNIPQLTLLQTKSSLNSIFLEVLKAFVKIFRKFADLSYQYWENMELIGADPTKNTSFANQLPSKNEAEEYLRLTEDFEATMKQLHLTDQLLKAPFPSPNDIGDDNKAYVISSPTKNKVRDLARNRDDFADTSTISSSSPDESMSHLRELNGKLITALRNLRVIKLNSQILLKLHSEVEQSKADVTTRAVELKDLVNQCLDIIVILLLEDADLIKVQERFILTKSDEYAKEGPFDSEALRLIESDVLAFGLEYSKLLYLKKFASTLVHLKESKQKKWNYYMSACLRLWDKLCESQQFISRFKEENSSLSDKSLLNLKMELNRLFIKRSEFIGSFIIDAQKEIAEYQSLLLYSEAQKRAFEFCDYKVDDETDDKEQILNIHEAELNRLKEEYESKRLILELYKELNEYLDDQKFLEESSKDSSRLLQKDSCKILMKEERIRKSINRNLPRVLKTLKDEVVKFNKEMISQDKKPFFVGGQDLYEKLLSIESHCSSQKRPKISRGVSPKKSSVSPKKSEPTNRLRSPIKVVKEPSQRRKSPLTGLGRHPRSINSTNKPSNSWPHPSTNSPEIQTKSPEHASHISSFLSPQKNTTLSTFHNHSQLPPLHSPLNPEASSLMNFSPSDSTLYSMCSRVSPLKDKNSSARNEFSSTKTETHIEGKENDYSSNDDLKMKLDRRISTHSLANSTIISGVNEDWKEQRLRDIRNRNDELHGTSHMP